jgi:phage repressor protein C with HTH and peptisase S24 domain
MTIEKRLKDERERLGLSQPQLGEIAGVVKQTVIQWEKGASAPSTIQLSALMEAGVDGMYILTGQRSNEIAASAAAHRPPLSAAFGGVTEAVKAYQASALGQALEGFVLVPHYEVQASAGNGSLVHSEQIVDYLAFKADWIRNTFGVAQKDLALISVKGDSMEPTLSNDDLILVDMRKNRVEDNAIYVLQLNDALLVKRIQHKLDGSLHVMSDNKHYDTEIVNVEHATDLNVLGRVVWSGRRM